MFMSAKVAVSLPFCAQDAYAGFCRVKNEITVIPSFAMEREQSQRTRLPLQLDQATPGGTRHSLRAADNIHLGEDRFYVRFHRAFADK